MIVVEPYDFEFSELENRYLFITKVNIAYVIRFKKFPYLFDSREPFSSDTYELIISIGYLPSTQELTLDPAIGPTLATIFDDFYKRNNLIVTIYICDSSDNRQIARQRKFSYWFDRFNTESYFKSDAVIKTHSGEIVPASIIFRRDNPYKYQILESFEKLTDGFNQK